MKNKAYMFLASSVIVGMYILYGLFNLFKKVGKYERIGDYIIVIVFLGLLLVLETVLVKKFRYYINQARTLREQEIKSESTIKPRKNNGCLVLILLVIFVPTILIIIGINMAPESDKVPKNVSIIMKQTNSNKEQAIEIKDALEQCDIKNINDIKHDEALDSAFDGDEKGYRLSTDSVKNIILYLHGDNTVFKIRYSDNVLYDNNEVVSKLSDFIITLGEKTNIQINSQNMIKELLKAPSTAKFPNITEWKFHKDKEKIITQSYVDSQNSFGAMLRNEFQVTFTPDGKTVTSLIVDGKEYISK